MTNTEFGANCSKRGCAIFAAALLFLLPGGPVQSQVTLTLSGGPNLATLAYAERPGTLKPPAYTRTRTLTLRTGLSYSIG